VQATAWSATGSKIHQTLGNIAAQWKPRVVLIEDAASGQPDSGTQKLDGDASQTRQD
jgi:hypothetical protein